MTRQLIVQYHNTGGIEFAISIAQKCSQITHGYLFFIMEKKECECHDDQ